MNTKSPFSLNRFEYENKHLYYLPPLFRELEERKPAQIYGSRGTGKTTLLSALNWRERIENSHLVKSLEEYYQNNDVFVGEYISVYFKIPEHPFKSFDEWNVVANNDGLKKQIFGFYIEIIALELISDAISNMAVKGYFDFPLEVEESLFNKFIDEYQEFYPFVDLKRGTTLRAFFRLLRRIRREFEKDSLRQLDHDKILDKYPLTEFCGVSRLVTPWLAKLCSDHNSQYKHEWYFKVCIDETEDLTSFHKKTLNSIMRVSKDPLYFYVSFSTPSDDDTQTLSENQSLQTADRNLIFVNNWGDAEFRDLAEGVSKVRVNYFLPEFDDDFSLNRILGHLKINILLNHILNDSVAEYAIDLLKRSNANMKEPAFQGANWEEIIDDQGINGSKIPPIYQTFVIEELDLTIPSPKAKEGLWKTKEQWRAEIRKKSVGAYLLICKKLGTAPKYCSAEMVLQLSDGCIRDYLLQMDEIFKEVNFDALTFVKQCGINISKQDNALKRASKKKMERVSELPFTTTIKVLHLVDSLGVITEALQTNDKSNESLKTPEKGRFRLKIVDDDSKEIASIIEEAVEAGYFSLFEKKNNEIVFRVHCSLAPYFNISYRGAYSDSLLDGKQIKKLINTYDKEEYKKERRKVILDMGVGRKGISDFPLFERLKAEGND